MNVEFYDINDFNNPEIVVIYAKYNNKIVMCKHKKRETWEIPGGHIEKDETPEMAAKRELYEETGATEFSLEPICKYSFKSDGKEIFCILYHSIITKIEELPNFEMKEIGFFNELPDSVTYQEIYAEMLKNRGNII